MALSATARPDIAWSGNNIQYPIKSAVTAYQGGYYHIDAAGSLLVPADTTGQLCVGVMVYPGEGTEDLAGGLDDSPTGNAGQTVYAVIDIGEKRLHNVPVAGADPDRGDKVYLTGDDMLSDLTVTATSNVSAIGEITEKYSATQYDVLLYSRATMAAL